MCSFDPTPIRIGLAFQNQSPLRKEKSGQLFRSVLPFVYARIGSGVDHNGHVLRVS